MARTKNWDPEKKRQQILDAAIAVLNRQRYHACPMDGIARQADIAKGTIYLYFKSKEELYFAVLCELVGRLRGIAEETDREHVPAPQKLRLLLGRMSDFFGTHKQIFASLHEDRKPPRGKAGARLHGQFQSLIAAVSRIFAQGVKDGELKNFPPLLAGNVFVALTSVLARQKAGGLLPGPAASPELLFEILMKGIAR